MIASAVQRGASVQVYDEQGAILTTIFVGGGERDGLQGFTATTVTIRRGDAIQIHDATGQVLSTIIAP